MSAANKLSGSRPGEAPQALPAAGTGSSLIAALGAPLDVDAGVGAVARPAIAAGAEAAAAQPAVREDPLRLLHKSNPNIARKVLGLSLVKERASRDKNASLFAPFEKRFGNVALAREHVAALGLTADEEKLLRALFSNWSLESGICFIDLWGVDLYRSLQSLALPQNNWDVLEKQFCKAFIHTYLSLFAKKCKEFFADALKGRDFSIYLFWPLANLDKNYFQPMLLIVKTFMRNKLSKTAKPEHLEIWKEAYLQVIAKIELGRKFLNHPRDPHVLLLDFTLEECFTGSQDLNGPEPLKTLSHLIAQLNFLLKCLASAPDFISIPNFSKILQEVRDLLIQFQEERTKPNLEAIRQALNSHFKALDLDKPGRIRNAQKALEGTLTHRDVFGRHGKAPTQQEFYSQMVWDFAQSCLLQCLLRDVLRILEKRVMPLVMPETASTGASFIRLIWNVVEYTKTFQSKGFENQPMLSGAHNLVLLFEETHFGQPAVASLYSRLIKLALLTQTNNFHYSQYMGFFSEWGSAIELLNQKWLELDTLRQQALSLIKKECAACYSLAELQARRKELTYLIKEHFLRYCLPLCIRALILNDIETLATGRAVEVTDGTAHLIPPELANLAAMEGIEETISDLIKEKEAEQILRSPSAPAAPQGPPAVAAPQIAPAAGAPAIAPPSQLSKAEAWILELLARTRAQESDPLWVITSSELVVALPARRNSAEVRQFKLRSGMNIRQVLEKIEEAGFQCLSQKGSHMKFKNEEGKVVIVPNNDAMPTGTLKSIEKQVEAATAGKE